MMNDALAVLNKVDQLAKNTLRFNFDAYVKALVNSL